VFRERASCALVPRLTEPLPEVTADPHALQQVFVNLVQNAAQAMPDGGEVIIETRLGPGSAAVEVAIIDDGPGVPASMRTRIFDPFVTSKEAGAGTGLGLAVCRHLVTSAGGSIDVGDGPGGRGAQFRVVLPIADANWRVRDKPGRSDQQEAHG